MVDAVITYVDGADPLWQHDYELTMNKPPLSKRFRDWGTLRYLLRGIEVNMPFIDNVYLVVSRDSQVPSWCNREHLRIIRHEDIIPSEHLPTFNSTVIELFLSKIEGLKERFIYFNDDIFPLQQMDEELFYPDGKLALGFANCLIVKGLYKRHVRNSDQLARRILGLKKRAIFKRPQHCTLPLLKSACDEVWSKAESAMLASLSPTRTPVNLNQSLFLDYLYYSGRAISRRLPSRFISLALCSADKLSAALRKPEKPLICINDVEMSSEQFSLYRSTMLAAFEAILPAKSRFEL